MYRFSKLVLAFSCTTGALSVLIAAYIAHSGPFEESSLRTLNSALQMMQFHVLALLVVAWIARGPAFQGVLIASAVFFVVGIFLFSGNIFLQQLVGISSFRSLTPQGGMAFVVAWLLLAVAAFQMKSEPSDEKKAP